MGASRLRLGSCDVTTVITDRRGDVPRNAQVVLTRLLVACSMLGLAGPRRARADGQSPAPEFVQVVGTEFVLDGQPFRFLGANVAIIHGQNERAGYESVLDAVRADGLRVVRIWALGEQSEPGKPHYPLYAFRIGEHGWVESSFEHLDRVLAAAQQRDLKVIVVLANRWKDYGGIATYLRWGGAEVARDAHGEPAGSALAAFFGCASCQEQYRQHVERVVTRTNSVTGIPYREDPTIMAWELINEASAVSAREEEGLLAWVARNARLVRGLDARHLISAGHIGYQTARERRVWRAVQSLPEIDFADAHVYPQTDPRVSGVAQLPALLDDPIALASLDVHKPFVFGEFGFDRSDDDERERWTRTFARHLSTRGVAGALIWIYEAPASTLGRHTINVGPDDADGQRVRRLLREAAARTQTAPAPLLWKGATAPRFLPVYEERGSQAPHRRFKKQGETFALEIEPSAFARAHFERAGVHVADGIETVWGSGEGDLEYRFRAPPFIPSSLTIEARISSELPGTGDGQDPRDSSDVEVSVDDQLIGTVRAKPDDGIGATVRVELVDARLLSRLFAKARTHTLRFSALESPFAGGLCIYGRQQTAIEAPEAIVPDLAHVRIFMARSASRSSTARARPRACRGRRARAGRRPRHVASSPLPRPAPRAKTAACLAAPSRTA